MWFSNSINKSLKNYIDEKQTSFLENIFKIVNDNQIILFFHFTFTNLIFRLWSWIRLLISSFFLRKQNYTLYQISTYDFAHAKCPLKHVCIVRFVGRKKRILKTITSFHHQVQRVWLSGATKFWFIESFEKTSKVFEHISFQVCFDRNCFRWSIIDFAHTKCTVC